MAHAAMTGRRHLLGRPSASAAVSPTASTAQRTPEVRPARNTEALLIGSAAASATTVAASAIAAARQDGGRLRSSTTSRSSPTPESSATQNSAPTRYFAGYLKSEKGGSRSTHAAGGKCFPSASSASATATPPNTQTRRDRRGATAASAQVTAP